MFKKIKMLFDVLSDILKFSISKIDDARYKKAIDEKIVFPSTMDKLIIVMGCYEKAFNPAIERTLFDILSLPYYNDIYNISNMNTLLIPFVVDGNIKYDSLLIDYTEFSEIVKGLVCDILNVNIEFDDHQMIV